VLSALRSKHIRSPVSREREQGPIDTALIADNANLPKNDYVCH